MSFTVRARVSARQFSFQHMSMLGALDQSLTLLSAGMSEVRIVDADGRIFSPTSFQQVLFGAPAVVTTPETIAMPVPDKLAA